MADDLRPSTFAPHRGSTFNVCLPDGQAVPLELTEVEDLHRFEGTPREEPFSLWFSGSVGLSLPQGLYRIEHEGVGPLELFIIPRQPGPDGRSRYEAIFN